VRSVEAKYRPIKPSILIADPQVRFRKTLERFLGSEFSVVGSVGDGQSLLEATQTLKPDVIVAEISKWVLNAIGAVRRLRAGHHNVRVIILSIHEEPAFVAKAQKSGARGYVLKRRAGFDLIPAIHEVLEGSQFVCPRSVRDSVDV